MDILELIMKFIQDPDYAWIVYLVAAFFIIDAVLLRLVGRRIVYRASSGGVVVGGNHQGVIITDDVQGGVHQRTAAQPTQQPNVVQARKTAHVLNMGANFSTVLATVIIVVKLFTG